MTRKDYVKLAAALREQVENMEATAYRRPDEAHHWFLAGWEVTVHALADALRNDNPRFDRERFYTAAGLRAIQRRTAETA